MPEIPPSLIPYVNVLTVLFTAAILAQQYARRFRSPDRPPAPPEVQIVGGALADRSAMQMVAESNRELGKAIDRLTDVIEQFAADQERRDRDRDHAQEIGELRRQIDRLISTR